MWMNEKGCGDTVEVVWKENNEESWDLKILEKKKNDTRGKELPKWSKQNFGNVCQELDKKINFLKSQRSWL